LLGKNAPRSLRISREEIKSIQFECGVITIDFVEGTVMRLAVDTRDITVDTTSYIPLETSQ